MLAAQGEYLFMADADFSMPVEEVARPAATTKCGNDVATAAARRKGPSVITNSGIPAFQGPGVQLLRQSWQFPDLRIRSAGGASGGKRRWTSCALPDN
ncbi:MAG: hypothetical protein R3C44_05335 [Chloroflexota bacterium]